MTFLDKWAPFPLRPPLRVWTGLALLLGAVLPGRALPTDPQTVLGWTRILAPVTCADLLQPEFSPDGVIFAAEADLRGADLSFKAFGRADLSQADWTGVNFFGADLREATLVGGIFRGAVFLSALLRPEDAEWLQSQGARFQEEAPAPEALAQAGPEPERDETLAARLGVDEASGLGARPDPPEAAFQFHASAALQPPFAPSPISLAWPPPSPRELSRQEPPGMPPPAPALVPAVAIAAPGFLPGPPPLVASNPGGPKGLRARWRSSWQQNVNRVRDFIAENGHSRVPSGYVAPDGHKTGVWVRDQHTKYQKGALSVNIQVGLEGLSGWSWSRARDRAAPKPSKRRQAPAPDRPRQGASQPQPAPAPVPVAPSPFDLPQPAPASGPAHAGLVDGNRVLGYLPGNRWLLVKDFAKERDLDGLRLMPRASLRGFDFSGKTLVGARLGDADCSGAKFLEVDLRHTDFGTAVLLGARFQGAILLLQDAQDLAQRGGDLSRARLVFDGQAGAPSSSGSAAWIPASAGGGPTLQPAPASAAPYGQGTKRKAPETDPAADPRLKRLAVKVEPGPAAASQGPTPTRQ